MKDITIAYIGGGSRGWAWTFMSDLAAEPALSGTVRLFDIDRKAAEANALIGNALSAQNDALGKWHYETAGSLGQCLKNADFVIISILPGTFDEMYSDVHAPEAFGIYQSVGDTAGPGGMIRALRAIPMFEEIANAVKGHAPDAWVINYTNPMSLCVKALYETFPDIKAFGCCHEVFGTQAMLAAILKRSLGIKDIPRSEIIVNVLGINHFTWFDRASYEGMDLFPVFADYSQSHFTEGFLDPDNPWADTFFDCAHRIKFDLFRKYGLIAAAGDRHLAEFLPSDQYLKSPQTVAQWKFKLTPVNWRKQDLLDKLKKSERLASKTESIQAAASGEEGVKQIKALCGLERFVTNVNIPNTARQISNLPDDAIVETNALFERDAIRPVAAGAVPQQILGLITPHLENHRRITAAAKNFDKNAVLEAFLHDPLIQGRLSEKDTADLVQKMLEGTKAYLSAEWFEE